jgi:hypothetical protein
MPDLEEDSMRTLALLTLAAVLLVAAPAQAADISGEWSITVNSGQGPIQATLKLKVEGEKLTGAITGGDGGDWSGKRVPKA